MYKRQFKNKPLQRGGYRRTPRGMKAQLVNDMIACNAATKTGDVFTAIRMQQLSISFSEMRVDMRTKFPDTAMPLWQTIHGSQVPSAYNLLSIYYNMYRVTGYKYRLTFTWSDPNPDLQPIHIVVLKVMGDPLQAVDTGFNLYPETFTQAWTWPGAQHYTITGTRRTVICKGYCNIDHLFGMRSGQSQIQSGTNRDFKFVPLGTGGGNDMKLGNLMIWFHNSSDTKRTPDMRVQTKHYLELSAVDATHKPSSDITAA